MNWRDFVVILQLGSGFAECRAADGSNLVALTGEIVEGNGVLVVDFVIDFAEAVVAVAVLRVGAGVIVGSSRAGQRVRRSERAEKIGHHRIRLGAPLRI